MNELQALPGVNGIALAEAQEARSRKSQKETEAANLSLRQQVDELKAKLGEGGDTETNLPWRPSDPEAAMRGWAERTLERPTKHLEWGSLDAVHEVFGDEEYQRLWARVGEEARLSIESGDDAINLVQPYGSPADYARLLVIRQGLLDEWSPRPGTEATLVDMLVQTRFMYETWLQKHLHYASHECAGLTATDKEMKAYGAWFPPRLSESEAVQLSAMMVTRFQNQFMKLVRAIRDLRRLSPSLFIQNAGQVNVGQQQVNVTK